MAAVADSSACPPATGEPAHDYRARLLKTADAAVRAGFVRKVYGILSAQLLATVVVAAPFVRYGPGIVHEQASLLMVSTITLFATLLVISFCSGVARKFPWNFVLLTAFTLSQGVLVGCVCATHTWQSVGLAAGMTGLVFLSLTVYAFTTKTDFTGFRPYLFGGLLAMLNFSVVLSLLALCGVRMDWATVVYDCIGVLLFTFYTIFDTQTILGGAHKVQYEIDDYVFASLNLYMDIINLFLYVLDLLGDRKRK